MQDISFQINIIHFDYRKHKVMKMRAIYGINKNVPCDL